MTRVLVIGHGAIGKIRAKALGPRLAGTVDPTPRAADAYAAPHFATFSAVPKDAYDAAIVATPHDLAPDLVHQLLAAGKKVLVEKPLGLNAAQASALDDAARKAALPCFVGYNYRFLPHVNAALGNLATLGKLRSIDMLLGHGGHPGSAKEWKLDPKRAGGGVIIDPGVHLLDLLRLIKPSLHPVAAQGSRGFFKTGIEEDVVCVLRDDACVATVRVSHVRWVNAFRIELVGEDGYALLEGRGGTYGPMTLRLGQRWAWADGSKRTQRETEETYDFESKNESFELELEAVLARWEGKPPSREPATFEDGAHIAKLVDELYTMIFVPS